MKSKISPHEYAETLEAIELNDIRLSEIKFKYDDQDQTGGILSINISDKYSFEDKGDNALFNVQFKISGVKENEEAIEKEKSVIFSLTANYKIYYFKKNEIQITTDFFEVFKTVSLSMLIWPYVRELTQNTLIRAGLPPFTIPMRRIN